MSEDTSEKSYKGLSEYIVGKREKRPVGLKDDKGAEKVKESEGVSKERFKKLIALLLGERVISKEERDGLLAEAKRVREKLEKEKPDPRFLDEYKNLEQNRRRVLWQIYSEEKIDNFSKDQLAGKASKSDEVKEIIKVWNEAMDEGKKKGLNDKDYGEKLARLEQNEIKVEEEAEEELGRLIDEVNAGYVVYAGKYSIKGGAPDNIVEDLLSRKYKKLEEERIPGEELRKLLLSDEYRMEREGAFKWGGSMDEFKSEAFLTYLATIPIDKDQFPDLQDEWVDFLKDAKQDVSGMEKLERYAHFDGLLKSMKRLTSNGSFRRVFRQLEEAGKGGERQVKMSRVFMASVGEAIDNELRKAKKEMDWLIGEYEGREPEFNSMLEVVFKDDAAVETKKIVEMLRGKKRGEELSEHEMALVGKAVNVLKKSDSQRVGGPDKTKGDFDGSGKRLNGFSDEEQDIMIDRFSEEIGGLLPKLEEVRKEGRAGNQYKTAEEYQAERQRGDGMMRGMRRPPDMPDPPDPGEEGGGERMMYAIPENLINKHLTVREDLGETATEAVERGLNTFLETAADERSLYYFSSHINNFLAGEKGDIDQHMHLLLHAAKGHEGLYKGVTGITQPDDLLRVGSAMSAGTDDDLVERKDFKHYGGVQGFKVWDGEQYSTEKTNAQQEFFSVGPFDVMDALSDNYWYSAFQDKGRGYDQHPKRHKMMAEVLFMNMGGQARMMRMENGKLERRYFIKGMSEEDLKLGLSMDEMTKMELRFGKQMKIAKMKDPRTLDFDYVYSDTVSLQDLAKSHLWMTMLGEAQWEISGRRALMDRFIDGRRNIYQWDKFMNYDIYGGKLGGHRGFPAFVTPDEKPILDLNRSDYISRYVDKMGAFLFKEGNFHRVDSRTGEPVPGSGVDGVKAHLANGNAELASDFVRLMKNKFIDPHKAVKDQELFRMSFLTEQDMQNRGITPWKSLREREGLLRKIKRASGESKKKLEAEFKSREEQDFLYRRWKTAALFSGEKASNNRELIEKMRWDNLFNYLVGTDVVDPEPMGEDYSHWPPRITPEERDYVFKELMGGTVVEVERDGKTKKIWSFGGNGPSEVAQFKAAKWFFEHYSDRYYFWGRLEHNQHLKEANYTRQAAGQAPKMLKFNEQPTADNLLEWTLPMFGFNPGGEVRKINYDAAQWNLRLLRRRPLAEMGAMFYSDKRPGLFNAWSKLFGKPTLAEAKARGVGPIDYQDQIDKYGYPKMKPRDFWKRPGESLMIMFRGAGQIKGHKALDAWARKHYIEKLWHAGALEWVQKEALMAEFLTPVLYGGSAITGRLLSSMIDIERKWLNKSKFFSKDKLFNRTARTAMLLATRYPALGLARLMQWTFLHTWIHDFGEFSKVYWNEIVAPAAFGENAQAAQLQV